MVRTCFLMSFILVVNAQNIKVHDPIQQVISDLKTNQIVAFGESHDKQEIYDFYFSLIENSTF